MKNLFKILFVIIIFPALLFSLSSPEKLFNKAMSQTEQNKFMPLLKELATDYQDNIYGQKALLELAKISLLNRDYKKSLSYLKKINTSSIKDVSYWFAKVYLKLNKNISAIYSAQNYIYMHPNNLEKDEDMLLTIAEAFIQKKSYYQALATLNSLRKSKYAQNKISLIVYKIGECYENMGKIDKAIKIYKKMKIDFPYDQYTYLAQDRIYELASLPENTEENKPKKLDKANVTPKDFDLYLQVGAYRTKKSADIQKEKLKKLGLDVKIKEKTKNGKPLFVVYSGPFKDTKAMQKASVVLKKNNLDFFIYKKYHE